MAVAAVGKLHGGLLLLLLLPLVVASHARELLQSGVSCPAQIPGCMARRCTTRILNSRETYVCLRCQRSFVPVKGSDGRSIVQCVCPQGTFLNSTDSGGSSSSGICSDCPIGRWCPGGNLKAKSANDNIGGASRGCNPTGSSGLTTKGRRSTRVNDCVASAGFVLPPTPGAAAVECPASTYSPQLNRLKTCLPCQSGLVERPGFKEEGGVRRSKDEVCMVPPGRFWELNVVRDCPKGLYREGYVNITDAAGISCLSCPEGWTTEKTSTGSRDKCSVLLPGRKVSSLAPGADSDSAGNGALAAQGVVAGDTTEACPLGFYFDGKESIYGCRRCPLGTLTKQTGSESVDDCLVPPGYYIQSADGGTTGQLAKCPNNISADGIAPASGFYRANWVAPSVVIDTDGRKGCTACGEGVLSRPTAQDERTDLESLQQDPANSDPYFGLVASSPFSCYILPGWGLTFDIVDFTKMRAIIPCPANTYGVAKETFGLTMSPCKSCTKNLKSEPGSTAFSDCTNPAGFGYTSEGANQCPDGFWAEKGSMSPCEQCPEGRYTEYIPGDGSYQSSLNSCKVKPGQGVYSAASTSNAWDPPQPTAAMNARPCPVGMFSPGEDSSVNETANPVCQQCLGFESTSEEGSTSCNVCKAGAGGAPGSCAACPYNTYQPGSAVFGDGRTCKSCPKSAFNHYIGDTFVSPGITFWTSMTSPYLCVPRYSQAASPAGHTLGLSDKVFVDVPSAASDTAACITACPADKCCIAEFYRESEYGPASCRHAILPPARPMAMVASVPDDTKPRLYYKLPPSEMIAAASVKSASVNATQSSSDGVGAVYTDTKAGNRTAVGTATGTGSSENAVKAKTMASGVFAICDMTDWQQLAADGWIGRSPNPMLVEEDRTVAEWDVLRVCNSEGSCHKSCVADASCWGFIYVPGKGFTLRTGEMMLGVRSFFVSPDPAQSPVTADGTSLADAAAYKTE